MDIFPRVKSGARIQINGKGSGKGRGKSLSDKERAARHFDKPVEEVTEEDIEKLPERGSGRNK